MDDKGKDWVERYRNEEFQRSKERLARFNQEMEKVTPKPTLRQWIRDGHACAKLMKVSARSSQ